MVHNNNVVSSYNALRAAATAGVRRVCQASSVNAIGGRFSRWPPRYDYFPVDEQHPTYAEDPYSLSKWICEQQADAIAALESALPVIRGTYVEGDVRVRDAEALLSSLRGP